MRATANVIVTALAACAFIAISFAAVPAGAQDKLPKADEDAIRAVITSQITAFQRRDGDAAFSHAAPGIRGALRSSESFMSMVEQQYAAVYNARAFEFRPAKGTGENLVQPVIVTGPNGKAWSALYLMQKQPDGMWKIAGVALTNTGQEEI